MRIVFAFALLLLPACVNLPQPPTEAQRLDPWIGRHRKEVILEWGVPVRTDSDGDGGEVLTYRRRRQEAWIGNGPPKEYVQIVQLWSGRDGKIYHWKSWRA